MYSDAFSCDGRQTAIETNRLVDVLRSLERTLGTHILALSANLRLNRVGGPPGGRDDKKGVHTRTTIINEITRHGEEDEAQALRGGDEKEAARRHTSPRGEEAAEAVAEAAAGLKKVRPSRFSNIQQYFTRFNKIVTQGTP